MANDCHQFIHFVSQIVVETKIVEDYDSDTKYQRKTKPNLEIIMRTHCTFDTDPFIDGLHLRY